MKKLSLLLCLAAPFLAGCGLVDIDLFTAFARWYGYMTFGAFLREHIYLLVILLAFIFVTLVFLRLLDRQFPSQGKEPGKMWIFKVTIVFFICAFTFVCGFAMFGEKRRLDKEKAEQSFRVVVATDKPV